VDKDGKTIDFMLSQNRDKESAIKFFRKAIISEGFPEKVMNCHHFPGRSSLCRDLQFLILHRRAVA
jgi:transposase-like protein